MNTTSTVHSILVIGTTGKTGLAILNQLAKEPSKPEIHAMVRDTNKLQKSSSINLTSVITGNARNKYDIENAVAASNADWVIVCVGNADNVAKNDIRTVNAKATVSVLQKPQFEHVRAMVLSSSGAGSSKIIVGFGIGKLISYHLRHILADHTGQEAAFAVLGNRTTIIRPTVLTENEPTGNLVPFYDNEKSPTIPMSQFGSSTRCAVINQLCQMVELLILLVSKSKCNKCFIIDL